jgi:hypothetical protein
MPPNPSPIAMRPATSMPVFVGAGAAGAASAVVGGAGVDVGGSAGGVDGMVVDVTTSPPPGAGVMVVLPELVFPDGVQPGVDGPDVGGVYVMSPIDTVPSGLTVCPRPACPRPATTVPGVPVPTSGGPRMFPGMIT